MQRIRQGVTTMLRKTGTLAAAFTLGAVSLAGCGGGSGSTGTTAGGTPGTVSPPPATPPPATPPPATPPPAASVDISGSWTTRESLKSTSAGMSCEGRSVIDLTTDSSGSSAGSMRSVSTCGGPSGRAMEANRGTITVTVSGTAVQFSLGLTGMPGAGTCKFAGTVSGSPPTAIAGDIECSSGWTGTWQATRGAPAASLPPGLVAIDVADMAACATAADGRVACWGPNPLGQLGSGDDVPRIVPGPSVDGYAFRKVSISTSGGHACGITTSGQALCWGNREGGRFGDGVSGAPWQFVTTPVAVSGTRTWVDIAAGGDHVCAIATGGEAYCWGHNSSGQLGTGNFTASATPVAVIGGLRFNSLTAHILVTCGITDAGAAYCWGDGSEGRLGTGAPALSNAPLPVKGNLTFASLSAGVWTVCGATTSGDGYCWGLNGSGELGIGSNSNLELEPRKVAGGLAWKAIAAGVSSTCGVTTGGRGYCWGGNLSGERGDGPFPAPDVTSPVPVAGDLVFESIDSDWHACGVTQGGVAYCWGPGDWGGVGDGTLVDRGIPTRVSGQQ